MQTYTRRTALKAGLGMSLGLVPLWAHAQDYPSKPIRIIVPYGAGTGLDVLVRAGIVQYLTQELNVGIVVENIAGSNGIIGTSTVARAPADGYTLLTTTQAHYVSSMMYPNLPYDPARFMPVARFGATQLVVVASANSSFSDARSFIAEARKNPKKLSFASLGSGSSAHMAGALFNSLAGIELLHVPYKDASQALTDTMRGEPSINFVALPTAAAQIKAGKLKAIAVTGATRSASLPDVPTLAESGVDGYDVTPWYALLAPEGTPSAVVEKLSASIMKIVATPEFRAVLNRMGMEPMPNSANEFTARLPAETARWQKIVSLTKVKVE